MDHLCPPKCYWHNFHPVIISPVEIFVVLSCDSAWFGLGGSVLVWKQDDEYCKLIQITTAGFFYSALVASHHCFIMKVTEVVGSSDGLHSLD